MSRDGAAALAGAAGAAGAIHLFRVPGDYPLFEILGDDALRLGGQRFGSVELEPAREAKGGLALLRLSGKVCAQVAPALARQTPLRVFEAQAAAMDWKLVASSSPGNPAPALEALGCPAATGPAVAVSVMALVPQPSPEGLVFGAAALCGGLRRGWLAQVEDTTFMGLAEALVVQFQAREVLIPADW